MGTGNPVSLLFDLLNLEPSRTDSKLAMWSIMVAQDNSPDYLSLLEILVKYIGHSHCFPGIFTFPQFSSKIFRAGIRFYTASHLPQSLVEGNLLYALNNCITGTNIY